MSKPVCIVHMYRNKALNIHVKSILIVKRRKNKTEVPTSLETTIQYLSYESSNHYDVVVSTLAVRDCHIISQPLNAIVAVALG